MDKNLLRALGKFHLPDLEHLMPEVEDYMKKYERAIQKERGMSSFISALFHVSKNLFVWIKKDTIQNLAQTCDTNTLITAHYPPSPPVFYVESSISPKRSIWKAELGALESYGQHVYSRFEEREVKLLLPERIKSDKIRMNEKFDEDSLRELFEVIFSAGKEAKDVKGVTDIEYRVLVTDKYSLYLDVLGNRVIQEIPHWYLVVTVGSKAEDLPERILTFDYSIGAVGGLRSFKKLEKTLTEGIMETAKNVAKFAKARNNIRNFSLKSGTYNVVLDAKVAGVSFHEYGAGHLAEAHRVLLKGESLPFSGKIGELVSSPKVTLIDDSRFQMNGIKPISYYVYDAEGVEKRKVEIIKEGKFNSYLHTKLTAGTLSKKEGGGVLTGNARVELKSEEKDKDYVMPIVPRMSTLYLKPGDCKLDELFEMARGGLYIRSGSPRGEVFTEMAVGHLCADEIYYIPREDPYDPKPIRVLGVWVYLRESPESFLQKIEGIGDPSTMKMDSGFCGAESGFVPHTIYSPAVYVKKASILLKKEGRPLKAPLVEF